MTTWAAVNLGTFPGGNFSLAAAASADGTVIVGFGDGDTFFLLGHPFRWTLADGLVDIGLLPGDLKGQASGVSGDGTIVVGASDDDSGPDQNAWRWTSGTGMVSLGHLPGRNQLSAYAISADGTTIVGQGRQEPLGTSTPFKWTAGGGLVDLGVLPGNVNGIARAVSADGTTIVGGSGTIGDVPWIWTSGGGLQAIPLPAGEVTGELVGVSADGLTACGFCSTILGGDLHAFVWTQTGGSTLLTSLIGNDGQPWGISGDGSIIVGGAGFQNSAALWSPPADPILLPDFSPGSAVALAISSDGSRPVGRSGFAVYWEPVSTGGQASIADLWFSSTPGFVDLTVESNRRKFISVTGGARNPGLGGEAPFGVQPPVFLSRRGAADTFADNLGRGGPFLIVGDPLDDAATNPPGSATSVPRLVGSSSGRGVLGDYRNGNLYAFNPATLTDNGTRRRWVRRWRALSKSVPDAVSFRWLSIDMQTGIQVPDGADPQLVLRWSDDGGYTFSDERIVAAGRKGETTQTIKFNRLGMTRRFAGSDRIFELSSSDPFAVAIFDADVEAS